MPLVKLEVLEVAGRILFRRFVELPYLLYRTEPRWAQPQIAYERWRLDPDRNPFFEQGDGAYFLLTRGGKPAGRITAHIAREGDEAGWFGFYDVVDDERCVAKLIEVAAGWLRAKGCTTMTGPVSFTADQEAGVLVSGFDVAGTTGRPWHPEWYASGLSQAGLVPVAGSDRPTWRLAAAAGSCAAAGQSDDVDPPAVAASHVDRRLLLRGPGGTIAAVPDLAGAAGGSAWALAKRLKRGEVDTCTVIRCDGDPAALVPALVHAAADAGYRSVIAPWSPDPDAVPETVHRLFTTELGVNFRAIAGN